jgi:hypothetical protein
LVRERTDFVGEVCQLNWGFGCHVEAVFKEEWGMMLIVAGEFKGVTKIYLVESSQIHELNLKIYIQYSGIDQDVATMKSVLNV